MAHSKEKFKSNGDKESPCFKQFLILKTSEKCLLYPHSVIRLSNESGTRCCLGLWAGGVTRQLGRQCLDDSVQVMAKGRNKTADVRKRGQGSRS
jgi:hypothetical protein